MDLNEDQLQRIIETNPGEFAVYRLENDVLRTLYYSPGLPACSGMDTETYSALSREDAAVLILENDRKHVREGLQKLVADASGDVDDTFRVVHQTRGFIWLHAKTRVIGTQNGWPVLLTVLFNSSDESAEHAALLDHANGKVYVIDRGTYELLYVNGFALRTWGRDDFCGKSCYEFIAGRHAPCPWCVIPEMQNGVGHQDEVYSPGTEKWYRIDAREMSWFGRDAIAFYSIDISEQKLQQQNLEIDKMDLEKIIGNVPVGVGVCQVRNGNYTQIAMNPCIYELLGVSQEDFCAVHSKLVECVHPDEREICASFMEKIAEPNTRLDHTFRYCRPGESTYNWLRIEIRTVSQGESVMSFACLTDVTEEKEIEASMRRSRQMYESAVETAQLSVWEYDIRSHRIRLSDNRSTKSDCEKFDIPQVIENVPAAVAEWIDDRDFSKIKALYAAIDAGAPYADCECWYRQRPGAEPRCEHIAYTTLFDEDGRPAIACGIGQNITAQKLEEEKYTRLYRQLVKANPDSLGTFRQNLTKNWCGDGQSPYDAVLRQQNSHTVDGYFAQVASRITDPEIQAGFLSLFNRESLLEAFRSGQTQQSIEYPVLYANGEPHWVVGYLNMVQNPATGDIESVTYALDVTERKKDEDIIRRITDEKCDYIGLIDSEKKTFEFRNINRDIAGLPVRTKIDYAVAVNYDLAHFVVPEDKQLFRETTALTHLTAELAAHSNFSFTYSHADGTKLLRKQLQYSYLGSNEREILIVQTDITAAYEQEQAQLRRMEEALRTAQEANRAKSEFLSRISHDIRTPMNVISGMTTFAFEDMDDRAKLTDDLRKIQNANSFLLSLINDILDISKIDSGKIELHPESCSYEEYITTIRGMFEPLCSERGLRFVLERPELVVSTVYADKTRLNQVTLNLLSNAVKYTPAGGLVRFGVSSQLRGDGLADVAIRVSDTGAGMSEDFQKIMFEPFTQEMDAGGKPLLESGSGLGLSIVKRLVDLMGGTIDVRSAPGRGTDVTVRFAFPPAETPQAPAAAPKSAENAVLTGRVLLAEDHPINMEIALRLLESFGLTPDAAENGAKAVEQFETAAPGTYRAILMDIQMPVMNGYEAARAIRALDRPDAKTIPIIAMTADAYAEDVARAKAAGMNAHVAKPLDPALLRRTLSQLL